ncbi:MAG TPA: hypothetical protein VEN81_02830, partial [Planctomycetota bacterium]|nr:hypothetical protein [Planctomycetota bacterium]
FLGIARDPVRHRALMPAAIVEKAVFALAVPILYLRGRIPAAPLAFAGIDALLGILFAWAYVKTSPRHLPVP